MTGPQQASYLHGYSAFNADRASRLEIAAAADALFVDGDDGSRFALQVQDNPPALIYPAGAPPMSLDILLAGIEALLANRPDINRLALRLEGAEALIAELLAQGVAIREGEAVVVAPAMFWQLRAPWLAGAAAEPFPLLYTMTNGKRHPIRRPKREGVLYARYIPWLDQVLSFRLAFPRTDLCAFNRWMNEEEVARIWEETGDIDHHRAYLLERLADPHTLPVIGCFDDAPFGYFEIYWAKENRLGPYYDADDYDRGWHVAIGEPAFRGKAWITAWLPSLMHFMFLDDPRTQRILGEPAAAHAQQIRNLERSGFAKVKHFNFPHKRALLVMLLRERFFNDRLWMPNEAGPPLDRRRDRAQADAGGGVDAIAGASIEVERVQ
ncbi:putative siderophore biosynthesis protein [Methylocella silvestris BL2]|uniref:Putative siderophore biosynthesis protein n=1 Tax=Methylocella silvestris (strain DSM 15510 / CIP 108128 / LMG 27833 / NCIMB 13906 / BL2) TaxID=395965 RepID=B8EQL3_METSB|nr:GNAT family N-acetyltransferase [Methylocella silvestris]ACK52226.1 putative siderophore biosynthesis protein [Methylocella silvestris BL2]